MAWTYLSTAPETSGRSVVRLLVGDNTSGDQLLQDEEIDAFLSLEGPTELAAAQAADAIGAKFARRTDKSVGRLRIAQAQASEHYFRLAKRLRANVGRAVAPYAGGISQSDIRDVKSDTDRPASAFTLGMHDFDGAAASS